jgi:spermidine dehydrogenase
MTRRRDRELGLHAPISRRDFLNGTLVFASALAASSVAPRTGASTGAAYPPAATGLRGSHVGSFEVAHALGREGAEFPTEGPVVGEFDLVVVGAGLSGLAAAFLYRQRRPDARVLLLDAHDDFGGHAKRNEFATGTRRLIGYGGSQSIDGPAHYSAASRALLADLGVDVQAFYRAFDQALYRDLGLGAGIAFSGPPFTRNAIVRMSADDLADPVDAELLAALPLSPDGRADLARLTSATDFLPGLDQAARVAQLRRQSYLRYVRDTVGVGVEVATLLKRLPNTFWGLDYDALSALEGFRLGAPGFTGLDPAAVDDLYPEDEPYIFHFPDGNAGLARLLVRRLIPGIAPGVSMADVVTAPFDYSRLDADDQAVRIRLSSTVVRVLPAERHVDVVYASRGSLAKVRGRHCIVAGYHRMIPFLLPELPAAQRSALMAGVRTPLVYTNVVLRNWHPFVAAGVDRLHCPTGPYAGIALDFPVSLGDYRCPRTPDEPIVVHMATAPVPGDGTPPVAQCRAGRELLYARSFADLERDVREQLAEVLGPYGLDPARDVHALTINRWPHGYAREYNELVDAFAPEEAPWHTARRPFGRIAIAGSESEGRAYADAAFDAAIRAVGELPV